MIINDGNHTVKCSGHNRTIIRTAIPINRRSPETNTDATLADVYAKHIGQKACILLIVQIAGIPNTRLNMTKAISKTAV